jgi:hypothetical protein
MKLRAVGSTSTIFKPLTTAHERSTAAGSLSGRLSATGALLALADRHQIADLRRKLVPSLMREVRSWRSPFHRSDTCHWIAISRAPESVIVGVIGKILRRRLYAGLGGLSGSVAIPLTRQRNRFLQLLPRHDVGELFSAEQGTWRGACRDLCAGALRKWTEPILHQQSACNGQKVPSEKIALRNGVL